ncbi:hypothetical protein [Saccharopolyspora spinosa]|uniref:Uncharacterized protein n=1 Tax=Saccharopolyspora spinosa TaxID=60894 RepID=A0A2N3XR72_SACSN|nr:hypothetical protein [Saccharopolyspora spinosa]PKW13165.1 hypothetical protein A8926_0674 [Saccharopolyspora spinosa]
MAGNPADVAGNPAESVGSANVQHTGLVPHDGDDLDIADDEAIQFQVEEHRGVNWEAAALRDGVRPKDIKGIRSLEFHVVPSGGRARARAAGITIPDDVVSASWKSASPKFFTLGADGHGSC